MQFKKTMTIVLSTALVTAMVTGCTAATTTTAGTDATIATFTQGSVSESTLNEALLTKAGMQTMLDLVDQSILDTVEPVTDEMTATVDSNLANIKNYYKDDFENSLIINGFENEEKFKASLLLNEQRNSYVLNYITTNILTDEDLQTYYDNYTPDIEASHILIKAEDDTEAALAVAKEKARALIDRINAGEDFAELATEFSADPGSGANGGALGSFGKGMMVPEFEEAAFALKNGEVTQTPVQTQFGFHIIKRTGGEDKQSFDAMKDEISKKLASDKLKEDQSIMHSALIQLRKDNGFEISNTTIAQQYKLFADQVENNIN